MICTGKDLGTISEICGINKISAVKKFSSYQTQVVEVFFFFFLERERKKDVRKYLLYKYRSVRFWKSVYTYPDRDKECKQRRQEKR